MNDQGKSTIQSMAAGFLGFVGVVGLGNLVMMHHGGAAAKAPRSIYAVGDVDPVRAAPLRAAPAAAVAAAAVVPAASSPLPVLPAETRDVPAAPAQSPAVAANAAAAPAATLAAGPRADMAGSASSSASAAAPAAASKPVQTAARKPAPFPKRLLAKDADAAVASTVHYGVSGRSELMGRAAGPVYNFSGSSAKSGGQVAADNAAASGALQQVGAAEQQLDASSVPDAQKAQLHQELERAKAVAAAPNGAATP
ncbi:MAG TPA: hypothetical protein VN915_10785 [Elusimicrobiota bacterium]|nr:hypothetical protein [Elusimicrobiota bacterium]